jgi:hypothetical protein
MRSPQPLHSIPFPPALNALSASDQDGNAPTRSFSSVFSIRVPGMAERLYATSRLRTIYRSAGTVRHSRVTRAAGERACELANVVVLRVRDIFSPGRENIFPLATPRTHVPLEGMTGPIRVLRIVLSDFELSSAVDVLAAHGGSVLYPKAWALLTAETERRGNEEQAQPIWISGDAFDSLPSVVQVLLRGNIVDEMSFAA